MAELIDQTHLIETGLQTYPPAASRINWNAPIMSSKERAAEFFSDLETRLSRFVDEFKTYKSELENLGIWDDFITFHKLDKEYTQLTKDLDSTKLKGNFSESDLEKAIDAEDRARNKLSEWEKLNRSKFDDVKDKYLFGWEMYHRHHAQIEVRDAEEKINDFRNKNVGNPIANDLLRQNSIWKELMDAKWKLNTFNSPYFKDVLKSTDDISAAGLMNAIKNTYRVLTFEDHIETVNQLIEDCSKDGQLILIKDQTKHQNDPEREGQGADYLTSNDEFMIDLVTEIGKKKGINTTVYKGVEGMVNLFLDYQKNNPGLSIEEIASIFRDQDLRIGIIDDAMYSGTQKSGVFSDYSLDIYHYTSRTIWDSNLRTYVQPINLSSSDIDIINSFFIDSQRLYVVGATTKALSIFENRAVIEKVYSHKLLPSIEESIQEPYRSRIKQIFFVIGEHTEGSDEYSADYITKGVYQIEKVQDNMAKPIVVTPFKVPDYASMSQLWYLTPRGRKSLFSLKEGEAAYIPGQSLLWDAIV